MKNIFVYVLVSILLTVSVFAAESVAEKSDFVELVENTDYCFDCHTIYKITKADSSPLTTLSVDFKDAADSYIFPDFEISYQVTEDYIELVDQYEPCNKTVDMVDNATGEEKTIVYESTCFAGQKEVTKTRTYYASNVGPFSTLSTIRNMYDAGNVGDSFYVKVSGKLKWGEMLDNVLTLNDYVYDEYAPWYGNFTYRRKINCTNLNNGMPIVINGTTGVMIGGSQQVIWTFCAGENTSLYYFNSTAYVVANDTAQLPHKVELGSGTDYNASDVWTGFLNVYLLNDGAGTAAVDIKSTANGTATNSSIWSSGYLAEGINTRGLYTIYHSYVYSLNDSTPFTMGCLYKRYSSASGYILNKAANSGECQIGMYDYTSSNDTNIFVYKEGDTYVYTIPVPINQLSTGNWQYVVMSQTESNLTGFIGYTNGSVWSMADTVKGASGCVKPTSNFVIGGLTSSSYIKNASFDYCFITNFSVGIDWVNTTLHNFLGINGFGNIVEEEMNELIIANESFGREAIIAGVDASEIASDYTSYSDKQVYTRLANGSQYKGTFDKFIVSGNKRWAFNYDSNSSSTFPAMFNITPVFYVWQRYNLTYYTIRDDVRALIDSTN